MLGIGANDSPMFKLFKLAGFGLKMLCASLKGKQRGGAEDSHQIPNKHLD